MFPISGLQRMNDPWYFSPQMKAYISKHYIFINNNKDNVSRYKRSILN